MTLDSDNDQVVASISRRLAKIRVSALIFLILILTVNNTLSQTGLYRSDEGSIQFTSDAPLELIQASTQNLRGVIDPVENTFAFSIDIRYFEGFNSNLQRTHFNENYLESHKYSRASFSGKIIERINWDGLGTHQLRAKGTLDIHGVKQERIIPSHVELFSDRVLIKAEFMVPLRDHDIDIPKIVAQKISEEIKVFIEITMHKEPSN